jgi:hypothetical protein
MSSEAARNGSVRAVCKEGIWHISRIAARRLTPADKMLLREAVPCGRKKNLAMYHQLGASAGVWQLELVKAALDEGEIAMGLAEGFALRCSQQPNLVHEICAPAQFLTRRAIVCALQQQGQRVHGAGVYQWVDCMQYLLAVVTALSWWALSVLRCMGENYRVPPDKDVLFAVHGEWSNRTRHLLGYCREGQGVIVLGRPRVSLDALVLLWGQQLGLKSLRLVRPFNIRSVLLSLPTGIRLCMQGAGMLARYPYKPHFAEQVAIAYRCLLGTASAVWWQANATGVKTVVYGHTGIADTTLLEYQQHTGGVETIHAVHGISSGLNFTGHSSKALFHCEYDARWHDSLGGYGQCSALEAPCPSAVAGDEGILLLSNYVHPMNLWFRVFGTEEELQLLADVAAMADAIGVARQQVVWKPHPIFYTLPDTVQAEVTNAVRIQGFSTWASTASLDEALKFHWVISTRSTVALDILRLGILPVIYAPHEDGMTDVVSAFSLQSADVGGLVDAANTLQDCEARQVLLANCWARVKPSQSSLLSLFKNVRNET